MNSFSNEKHVRTKDKLQITRATEQMFTLYNSKTEIEMNRTLKDLINLSSNDVEL